MSDWELMVSSVLTLLARREISAIQAESWLWMLVELEETRTR